MHGLSSLGLTLASDKAQCMSPLLFALYVDDNIANISKHMPGVFVFLCADDILILSPSVNKLQDC